MHRTTRIRIALAGLLIAFTACSPTEPTTAPAAATAVPTRQPVAGLSWAPASVEQPAALVEEASNRPSFCSPCHSAVQTSLGAVASRPGALLAAGWFNPFRAAAWTSNDRRGWRLAAPFPGGDGGLLDAAAPFGDAGWVVGGSDVRGPAIWSSADGRSWVHVGLPVAARDAHTPGVRGVVRALARSADAWVAAGEVGPPAEPRPAVWVSTDAATWRLVEFPASSPGAATGGSVAALAVDGTMVVAVGRSSGPISSAAAAWRTEDAGRRWLATRVLPDLAVGVMSGVARLPGGAGWVAVGAANDDAAAAPVWRSADAVEWTLIAGEDSRSNLGSRIRMTAVAAGSAELVAVGWKSDAGNGSAVAWQSADGTAWRRAEAIPEFSGGGAAAVASVGDGYVATGSLGWPDDRVATVWVSPSGD
jgi:hypothetical protein